jgi:hypothetical protein
VFGVTTDSAVTSRAADGDGKAIWDMDLDINLAGTNPRVPKTWDLIKTDQVKLGVSIGAMIEEWEFKDEKQGWWGGLVIKKVNLLEASIVGIPANPRSWVQNGVAALKAAFGAPDEPEGDAAGPLTPDEVKAAGEPLKLTDAERAALPPLVEDTTAPNIEASADPTEDPEDPDTIGEASESAAPETEGTATVTQASTGTAEEPTSPVDLDAAKAAITSEAEQSGDPSFLRDLVVSLIATAEAAQSERDAALAERDAVQASLLEKDGMLSEAAEIIAIIAKSPLGRKTSFSAPVKAFQTRFAGIYDREFLELLERE